MKEFEMIELLRKKGYTVKPAEQQNLRQLYIVHIGGEDKYYTRRHRVSRIATNWPDGTMIAKVDFDKLDWEEI